MNQNKTKFIFLDRDGIINEDRKDFVKTRNEFRFVPGIIDSIKKLNENGFEIIIVTNQSGVAGGFYTEKDLNEIHENMLEQMGKKDATVKDIFYCPHHPQGKVDKYRKICDCRKPKPGLILKAAKKYNIDPSETWMIGDSERNIEAGRRAGCRTIRIEGDKGIEGVIENISTEKNSKTDSIC